MARLSQYLTVLSFDPEANVKSFGLNFKQVIGPSCKENVFKHLFSFISHILIVESSLPDAIHLQSGLIYKQFTWAPWPEKVFKQTFSLISHNLIVESLPAVIQTFLWL